MLPLLCLLALAQSDPWHGEKRRMIVELKADTAIDGHDFTLKRRFRAVPALAVELPYSAYLRLRALPQVASITEDLPIRGGLAQAVPAIAIDLARTQYPATGKDVVVAVIDSGTDFTHPALQGSKLAEHCFTQGDCLPNRTNESTSAIDEAGHGTEVTGVIRSSGASGAPVGVAPGAKIIAVRVLDSMNRGFMSDWLAGLEWVYDNRATTGVRVVNMSLVSDALYSSSCAAQQPSFAAMVNKARAAGILIFVASGNDGSSTQITAPACLPGVIAVGATYDADLGREPNAGSYGSGCFDATTSATKVACFSDTNASVKLLAPGAIITTTRLGGGTANVYGTSFASPMAAGVAALLLELNPNLTATDLEQTLTSTGTPVTDTRNGRTFPLVNALGAAQLVADSFCASKTNGTACEDGDACTVNDVCASGKCIAGVAKTCAPTSCQTAASCDPTTGACVGPAKANGTACDDGDLCTSDDACNAGVCAPGATKSCGDESECRAAGTCDPTTGACVAGVVREDGGFCDDGNACTSGDVCSKGECVATETITCNSPPACHSTGSCDATSGSCVYQKIAACVAPSPQSKEPVVTETTRGCAAASTPLWIFVAAVIIRRRRD